MLHKRQKSEQLIQKRDTKKNIHTQKKVYVHGINWKDSLAKNSIFCLMSNDVQIIFLSV